MLTSAAQQSESALSIHIPRPLKAPSPPPPLTSSQSAEPSSLFYSAASGQLSALHMVVCIWQCYSLNSPRPPLPPLCSHVHSPHLHLSSCPTDRVICTFFSFFESLFCNLAEIFSPFLLMPRLNKGKRYPSSSISSKLCVKRWKICSEFLIILFCMPLIEKISEANKILIVLFCSNVPQ